MATNRKERIRSLLQGLETGDPESVAVVRHALQAPPGAAPTAAAPGHPADSHPRVNPVRIFADGDFVFAHSEYEHVDRHVGFDVFRFAADRLVEHWPSLQPRPGPNPSGHSMVDGQTRLMELEKTASNRALVRSFVEEVLIGRQGARIYDYVKWNHFVEHNPRGSDDRDALIAVVAPPGETGTDSVTYEKCHLVLAEGNFVLSICGGTVNQAARFFCDLWCLEHDYIVEHWDTTSSLPPPAGWLTVEP